MSFALKNLKTAVENSSNVRIFHNLENWGKTLEFDMSWKNYDLDFFIKDIELEEDIMSLIEQSVELERNLIATKYLTYADEQKGEVAFDLLDYLNTNEEVTIRLPSYIEDSILWACYKEVQ